MVRYVRAFIGVAVVGVVAGTGFTQDRPSDVTVQCASQDGRRVSCPAKLEGYTFKDLRKRSDAPCEAGRNWGYTERGVWVDNGCRADFEFEYVSGAPGEQSDTYSSAAADERVVECASDDGRREECGADLRGMRFTDVRQHSRSTCEIGRNFGYNDRGVWVDEGCRGEFRFRAADRFAASSDNGISEARGRILNCESNDEDYEHCEAPGIVAARVANQISRSECVQGTNWGVDDRGIWVDRGCRADFEVFTRLSDSPSAPSRY
jgi:hypothetical protein